MSKEFQLGIDRFYYLESQTGLLWVMHQERADYRSSHSVGNGFATRDAAMEGAREHIAILEDLGNCQTKIVVSIRPFGRPHIAHLGARLTKCGRALPEIAEQLRIRVDDPDTICRTCQRAY